MVTQPLIKLLIILEIIEMVALVQRKQLLALFYHVLQTQAEENLIKLVDLLEQLQMVQYLSTQFLKMTSRQQIILIFIIFIKLQQVKD
jgi:hypothetical protein